MNDFSLNIGVKREIYDDRDRYMRSLLEAAKPLMAVHDDFYLEDFHELLFEEDVVTTNNMKMSPVDAVSTTKALVQTSGNVLDASGGLLRTGFDVVMHGINLCGRVLVYILGKVANLPMTINNLFKHIADIPHNIMSRIRGDIDLYINAADLKTINDSVILKITEFAERATKLIEGNSFGTFLSRRGAGITSLGENDIKHCRELLKIYESIKVIEFTKSTIKISNDSVAALYFGGNTEFEYINADGKKETGNYYTALLTLFESFRRHKEFFIKTKTLLVDKIDRATLNRNLEKLKDSDKKLVLGTVDTISKFSIMVGNMMNYITSDLKTLDKAVEKVLKRKP